MHERPGVYSSYDASTVVSAGRAAKVIGVAAKAVKGTAGEVVTLTGYAAGVAAFGEDAADTPGMSTILRLLFANGASTVAAVRVAEAGAVKDYQDAFAALGGEEARILVCDSAEETVQQALRTAVEDASAARMEVFHRLPSGPRPCLNRSRVDSRTPSARAVLRPFLSSSE